MLRIAFTPPEPAPDHPRRIAALLEAGWSYVHVRYPDLFPAEVAAIVEQVPEDMRRRLVLHSAFGLADALGVGGLHLNRRSPEPPEGWAGRLSRSCHSAEEANLTPEGYAYVTLSPVFASISKPGYGGDTSVRKMRQLIRPGLKVVGLGGVTPENAAQLAEDGFDGFAMLGALGWNDDLEIFNQKICFNL